MISARVWRRLLDLILYVAIGAAVIGGVFWLAVDDSRKPLADLIWKWAPVAAQTVFVFGYALAWHMPRKHRGRFALLFGGLFLGHVVVFAWFLLPVWRLAWGMATIPLELAAVGFVLFKLGFPPR